MRKLVTTIAVTFICCLCCGVMARAEAPATEDTVTKVSDEPETSGGGV